MHFRQEGDRAVCDYVPQAFQGGYPGRMHGGVVSTMLDEAMGYAVYYSRAWGATARLSVRFRKPVPMDEPLRIEAWITRARSRLIECRAEMSVVGGELLAEADGAFMRLDASEGNQLSELARRAGRNDAPEVVT